jgi:ATP-dependent DNA helicase RecG
MPLSKSPQLNLALQSIGITTPEEVLAHLPRRYENFSYTPKKAVYADKERIVVLGKLTGGMPHPLRFAHRTLYRFYFESTEGETFLVEAWNRAYLSHFLEADTLYTLSGVYEKRRKSLALVNILKGQVAPEKSLRPVYSLPNSIPNHTFATLVKRCLELERGRMADVVPSDFVRKYRLLSHYEALVKTHEPTSLDDVHEGLRVLKYEEALLFSLRTQIVRGANKALQKDARRKIDVAKLKAFIRTLPYTLTEDQKKVIGEALKDMDSPSVMYRLLQGDVGTGKTLVAALLAYANYTRSEQTALMAPTDALARQHYETLSKLFAGTPLKISLLVGSLPGPERAGVLEDIEDGTSDLIIGTHSLFSHDVTYAYLGLAIIDEQHKFGVNQRTLLVDKGEHADLLLMSATPIPRTLTLTIYGDLDVSTLTEFPSGKRHVTTLALPSGSEKIQELIQQSLASQHRVFVVVPQIEGAENGQLDTSVKEVYDRYNRLYPGKVTLMHGKLDEESKNVALMAFRSGLCPILVATSLIEVGIDVKEANLMVIYSPSHFALSSLHQLRGRIGRDGSEATCVLALPSDLEESDKEKLEILLKTTDGFAIAEEDLKLRGPGEIAGQKQSGLPDFSYANIIDDFKIFECARDDAAFILSHSEKRDYAAISAKAETESQGVSLA